MDPVTFMIIAGGMKALGGLMQGFQTSDALKYQAKVNRNNAIAAMYAANLNAQKLQLQYQKFEGAQRAGYGASGVEATSGSVLDVIGASAANAEMDRQNIIYGGQIRATNFLNEARSNERSAASARLSGAASAIGSAIDTYGDVGSKSGGGGSSWTSGDVADSIFGKFNVGA